MSTDNVKTVYATFTTREAADRAIEHLVQQHGIDRSDVFAEPAGDDNTVGTRPSGGDAARDTGEETRSDAALSGEILLSVDVSQDEIDRTETAFRSVGAKTVSMR